jgi:predicted transcriptional regulator
MTLREIITTVEGEILSGPGLLDREVKMGCGSDLLSDVLAFIKPGALLLTGLTNSQVIRTAEMADIQALCFVRGKRPPKAVIALAEEKDIPLLATPLPMFEACGRLYRRGLASSRGHEG